MTDILYDSSIYIAKTAIVLFYLALLYRLLGKRYVAQMNLYDLAAIAAVSNAVQNGMTEGKGALHIGMVSAFTLIGLGWLLSKFLIKAPRLEKVIVGSPTLLVYEGQVQEARMRREQVSQPELEEAMHAHGLSKVEQVGMAVLEVDGSISIVPTGHGCKFESELV